MNWKNTGILIAAMVLFGVQEGIPDGRHVSAGLVDGLLHEQSVDGFNGGGVSGAGRRNRGNASSMLPQHQQFGGRSPVHIVEIPEGAGG